MASEGPNSPSHADQTGIGWYWNSDENIYAEDGDTALFTNYDRDPANTAFLEALNFSFDIPSGATINGIEVGIKKGGSGVYDDAVSLIKAGTPQTGTNYASASEWPSSLTYVTYGGASDLWGGSWSAADINGSGFGAGISANVSSYATAEIDHIRITVYYTEGGGGASAVPAIMNSYRQRRA